MRRRLYLPEQVRSAITAHVKERVAEVDVIGSASGCRRFNTQFQVSGVIAEGTRRSGVSLRSSQSSLRACVSDSFVLPSPERDAKSTASKANWSGDDQALASLRSFISKLRVVLDLLHNIESKGEKVLIFARHKDSQRMLASVLSEEFGFSFVS